MLYALKQAGVRTVAYGSRSHKSVKEGCTFLGLNGVELDDGAFPISRAQTKSNGAQKRRMRFFSRHRIITDIFPI